MAFIWVSREEVQEEKSVVMDREGNEFNVSCELSCVCWHLISALKMRDTA